MTATTESIALVRAAAAAADQKKAENIVAFDVSESLAITDVFMVASAPNERQVSAVVDAVEEALIERFDRRPLRREGKGNLITHVDVMIPTSVDQRSKELLEQLREHSKQSVSLSSTTDERAGGLFSRLRNKFGR